MYVAAIAIFSFWYLVNSQQWARERLDAYGYTGIEMLGMKPLECLGKAGLGQSFFAVSKNGAYHTGTVCINLSLGFGI